MMDHRIIVIFIEESNCKIEQALPMTPYISHFQVNESIVVKAVDY